MSAACPILGFVVRATPRDPNAKARDLADSLIETLELHSLIGRRRGDAFVVSREGSQATQADRELVLRWADRWAGIAEIQISDLVDLREE